MENAVQILSWAESFGALLYFLAFFLAASEATIGLSMLLPGSLTVMMIGATASLGYIKIYYVIPLAILGAVIGDNIGYFLGRRYGVVLVDKLKFIDKKSIKAAEDFIKKHGAKSVMLGRFVPFVKETIPFVAGTLKMNRKKFMLYNFLGAIGWSAMWPGMGYLFAKAVLSGKSWVTSTQLLIAGIVFTYLAFILLRELQVMRSFNLKLLESFKSKYFFKIVALSLALYSFFVYLAILVIESSPKIFAIDNLGFWIFEKFHLALFYFFAIFTYSAKWFILFPFALLLCVWFYKKYKTEALKFIASLWSTLVFASALILSLKHAIARERPSFARVDIDGFAFPSGHAGIATAFSAILIFLILKMKHVFKRRVLIALLITWAILIYISRIYLGVHYTSDILGGIIVGLIASLIGASLYLWLDEKERMQTLVGASKSGSEKPEFNKERSMKIYSTAFKNGESIPKRYTCDGENINPELVFENVPDSAESLVLIMGDPDVPEQIRQDRHFTHWLLYNIPADLDRIKENSAPGTQGKNDESQNAYTGPCPPVEFKPTEHRYFFKLYALDRALDLPEGLSQKELEDAISGHVIEDAEFYGVYDREK